MPGRSFKICTYPGCSELIQTKSGRCEKHTVRKYHRDNQEGTKRITGSRLTKMRRRLFQKNPLCVMCLEQGKTTLAVQRDHIQPLAEGGSEHVSNTQALCKECHALKSAEEARRGTKRYHQG